MVRPPATIRTALLAGFLVIFAVSSSIAAWDWVMSIDPHWFSTMFGWYVFATWWVCGLAVITLIVAVLKEAGYLKIVRADHLHDLVPRRQHQPAQDRSYIPRTDYYNLHDLHLYK